jgi:hypothetical protein
MVDGEIDPRGDEKLLVEIYLRSVQHPAKTEEAGHPVFEDVPFIKIQVPGDPTTLIDTKLRDHHKRRFARHWAHFQQYQNAAPVIGTPLAEWAVVSRSQADNLRVVGVMTVEQLADLTDAQVQRIGMGGEQLRRKAQTWLKQATDSAGVMASAGRMSELEESNKQLQAQVAELMAAMNAPRRGRPPKEQEAA